MSVTLTTQGPVLLSTLARVKAYIPGIGSTTNSDALLNNLLITTSSRVMGWLERDQLVSQPQADYIDGQGGYNQFLKDWPVTDITQVMINGFIVPYIPNAVPPYAVNFGPFGYTYEPWGGDPPGNPTAVQLLGGARFWRGQQNVVVNYVAGYLGTESRQVPTGGGLLVALMQYGLWIADNVPALTQSPYTAFTYVPGTVSEGVYTPPSLATGQYSYDPTTPGNYYFSAADENTYVTLNYSYVPYGIEEVVWELVNERLAARSRPGIRAKGLAGQETTTYDLSGMPAYAQVALQPYKSVIPL